MRKIVRKGYYEGAEREEGISLVTFLRNYRMEKAASLLRETEYKISESG